MTPEPRELTREERTQIRKLVTDMCANFCKQYGCMPLGCTCYMFNKHWAGNYCKYFQGAVLPLDPLLESGLLNTAICTRPCAFCGMPYPVTHNRKLYCGDICAEGARRKQTRERIRKKRRM